GRENYLRNGLQGLATPVPVQWFFGPDFGDHLYGLQKQRNRRAGPSGAAEERIRGRRILWPIRPHRVAEPGADGEHTPLRPVVHERQFAPEWNDRVVVRLTVVSCSSICGRIFRMPAASSRGARACPTIRPSDPSLRSGGSRGSSA